MLIRLAFAGLLVIHASNILAEVPPPQPPHPTQAYPVQPATGAVVDPDANAAKLAVLQQKQRECEQLQKEIRQLQSELGTIEQFSVHVQFLEVSLTKLKKLATDFTVAGEVGSFQIDGVEGLRRAIIATGVQSGSPSSTAVTPTSNGFVEWLKKNNIAKEIASPTLIVADGHPANLFTGLEMPAPAFAAQTTPNNDHRTGIEIDLTAFSRENNRVRIDIRGSVRELDEAHSIVVNGANIPAMEVHQFNTSLQGPVGKPFVISGLVEARKQNNETSLETPQEIEHIALVAIVIPNRIDTTTKPVSRNGGEINR